MSVQINTQDNAITSHPIFTVQQQRRVYGEELCNPDGHVWILKDDNEYIADEEEANNLDELHRENFTSPILDVWTRYEYEVVWVMVQPFFTRDAAQKYIELNGHNMQEPRIFVNSGYRNYEWQAVREYISSCTE